MCMTDDSNDMYTFCLHIETFPLFGDSRMPSILVSLWYIYTSQKCHQNFRFTTSYLSVSALPWFRNCYRINIGFSFGSESKEIFEYDLQIKWKTLLPSVLHLWIQRHKHAVHVSVRRVNNRAAFARRYRLAEIQAISSLFRVRISAKNLWQAKAMQCSNECYQTYNLATGFWMCHYQYLYWNPHIEWCCTLNKSMGNKLKIL